MRPAARLKRRQGGGFRLEGFGPSALEGVPSGGGFDVAVGERVLRLIWSVPDAGWLLLEDGPEGARELGRTTTADPGGAIAPSSVLLADGRLFRWSATGPRTPRIEVGLWGLPGAYAVLRPGDDGWTWDWTVAGESLEAGPELGVLIGAETGRLDGWW